MSKLHPHLKEAPLVRPATGERLDSWKEIARYLNRDVRTVQRWEENDGLPVYRKSAGRLRGSPVYAYSSEIDAWLRKNGPSHAEKEPEPEQAASAGWKTRPVVWVSVSIAILVTAGTLGWHYLYRQTPIPPLRVVRLTTDPGIERYAAISPDGKQVAFAWNGPRLDNFDIYVKFVAGGEPLRLTTHPGVDGWPAWSPDGSMISFVRWVRGSPTCELLTIPALRGTERKIHEFAIPPGFTPPWPAVCWTPDGKWIIGGTAALEWISVQTLELQRPVEPVANSAGDRCPAISPDGHNLAFLRASSGHAWDLYTLAFGPDYRPAGRPRQLTTGLGGTSNPMWTADSREVLYITENEGAQTLWRVPYNGSRAASPIESLGPIGFFWAISPRGDRLVYADNRTNPNIWRADLEANEKGVISVVAPSTKMVVNPQISPDGKRLAYVSKREKGRWVWVSDLDGANPIALAPIAGERQGPARWSSDGKQIVFECQYEGNDDVCAVPSGGGKIRRLTKDPANDSLPSWSHDGKWVYMTSNRDGSFQIWKVPSDGGEAGAIKLTKGGGYAPVESPDTSTVYFAREPISPAVWRVAAGGGEESQVGTFRILGGSFNFAVGSKGIYYASSENAERGFKVWLYRYSTDKLEQIRLIDKKIWSGMSVSPDGRWLWFSSMDGSSDLYMVENFR